MLIFVICLLLTACVSAQPIIAPEPTQPPIIIESEIPTIYLTLHERLGIPLDKLLAMPDDAITQLIEQNTALLGLSINETPSVQPASAQFTDAIRSATDFLLARYDPTVGLLNESPETASDRYWLLTDNRLAAWALAATGHAADASTLHRTIDTFAPSAEHGVIESIAGVVVHWPPRTPVQNKIAPGIWLETRSGDEMLDWSDYADLTLYAAINAANQGQNETARDHYDHALSMFDGLGFQDKAFDGRYTTYKLALTLLAAQRLNITPSSALVSQLLAQQSADGGFVAHYTADGQVGDANTETTALALLALSR